MTEAAWAAVAATCSSRTECRVPLASAALVHRARLPIAGTSADRLRVMASYAGATHLPQHRPLGHAQIRRMRTA